MHILRHCFATGHDVAHRGRLAMSGGTAGIVWVEARGAVNTLQQTGESPATKNYSAPNVDSTQAEAACPGWCQGVLCHPVSERGQAWAEEPPSLLPCLPLVYCRGQCAKRYSLFLTLPESTSSSSYSYTLGE